MLKKYIKPVAALAAAGLLASFLSGCVTDSNGQTAGDRLLTSVENTASKAVDAVIDNPQIVPCLAAVGATLASIVFQFGDITGDIVGTNGKSLDTANGLCHFRLS